jgi:hypothetical protein
MSTLKIVANDFIVASDRPLPITIVGGVPASSVGTGYPASSLAGDLVASSLPATATFDSVYTTDLSSTGVISTNHIAEKTAGHTVVFDNNIGIGASAMSKITIGDNTFPTGLTVANVSSSCFLSTNEPSGLAFAGRKSVDGTNFIQNLFLRSRGTNASPTVLQNADGVMALIGYGYDGTQYRASMRIDGNIDGVPATGVSVPGNLVFKTSATTGTMTEAMRIDSAQNVGIGTTTPACTLHVVGKAVASTPEKIARFMMSDNATNYVSIFNNTGSDGGFNPAIQGYSETASGTGILTIGAILAAKDLTDSGACINFQGRRWNEITQVGTATTAKNILGINNYGTRLATITYDGKLGIGVSAPSGILHTYSSDNNAEYNESNTGIASKVIKWNATDKYGTVQFYEGGTIFGGVVSFGSTATTPYLTSLRSYADNNGYLNFTTKTATITTERLRIENDGTIKIPADNQKLQFGTGNDMEISYDGTDAKITTDLVAPSDLVIDCGTDKTIELAETVWDDMRTPVQSLKLSGVKPPSWTAWLGGQVLGFSDQAIEGNEEEVFFTLQLPHGYKEGTDIMPHVHWVGSDTATGNVCWKMGYTWANIASAFGASAVVTGLGANSSTANTHILTELTDLTGTGKTASSMLNCSLRRNSSNAADTYTGSAYLLEFDVHYEIDTIGSRTELAK